MPTPPISTSPISTRPRNSALFERGAARKLTPAQRRELAAREWLSVEEMAQYLGIGTSLAYRLVGSGEVPSVRLGRKVLRVKRSDLDAMAGERETA